MAEASVESQATLERAGVKDITDDEVRYRPNN